MSQARSNEKNHVGLWCVALRQLENFVLKSRTTNFQTHNPKCTPSIHFLAGASYLDVVVHPGISRSAFYTSVYRGIDAIWGCQELQLKMPMPLTEMHDAAIAFKNVSLDGRLNG